MNTTVTDPLAYLTAKGHGLLEMAEDILATAGLNEEDIAGVMPTVGLSTLRPPPVVATSSDTNWPSVGVTESFFDRALAAAASGEPVTGQQIEYHDELAVADSLTTRGGLDDWSGGDALAPEGAAAEEAEEAWDLAPADDEEPGDEQDELADERASEGGAAGLTRGIAEAELWVRNSPLAADHVAAGSFATAMALLQNQVGAVNFEPLKPLFLALWQSSKLYLPGAPSLPDLVISLRRTREQAEARTVLPVATLSLQSITSGALRAAYSAFQKAKFAEAATLFRSILQSLLLVITKSSAEAAEVSLVVSLRPGVHYFRDMTSD